MKKAVKNILFKFSTLGNYKWAFFLFRFFPKKYPHLSRGNEHILIEGFPRSGNSFFVVTMQHWNPAIKIAHHSHLFGNVLIGLSYKTPVVVIIRNPADAIASAIIWDHLLSVEITLKAWIHFYQQVLKVRNKVLLLTFEEITENPHSSIERINSFYKTNFNYKQFTEIEKSQIFKKLSLLDDSLNRDALKASIPNNAKNKEKKYLQLQIQTHPKYSCAIELYRKLIK